MFTFDNTYARLPERFYARVLPTAVRRPQIVKVNHQLAELLGIDPNELASPSGAEVLSGNVIPAGAEPIALAYAGHQFGSFVPQLGDGRAILLGEVIGRDGQRRDVQLKGAGRTPFSRRGDGRAALGPVLREYLISEAMAALSVPTTRSLAAVTTGESVFRETALPGAVLTRVAASHIRVGTFEFFAVRDDREALATLASYSLSRHYPDAVGTGNDALALLERVSAAQAVLVARWLGVGFIHGVMNTDNTAISGETIDYGPCAFLDEFDAAKTFSSIDVQGRYAFAAQPRIAAWNLARLAEALLPLLATEQDEAIRLATARLDAFSTHFAEAYIEVLRAKLGLLQKDANDQALANDLLARLANQGVDYTVFFRRLCDAAADSRADAEVAILFQEPASYLAWAKAWRQRLAQENLAPVDRAAAMRRVNPAFIPRNHRVQEALHAAAERNDYEPFESLLRVITDPYTDHPNSAHLADPPRKEERVLQTFCGT